jgi:hypothetical protein
MALSWHGRKIQLNRGLKLKEAVTFNISRAQKWQETTLKKLLYRAQSTEYGKKYQFEDVLISGDLKKSYAQKVPIVDYSDMHPYWIRAYKGEENITWPGKVDHFALSSGTSEGASKYIPVTNVQLKSVLRGSRRQMLHIVNSDIPKDFLTKDYLMVGGSTQLQFDGTTYSGDLSGITTQNVPQWFDKYSQPSPEIRALTNWNEKIEAMVNDAHNWDVVMIAGVPAWIKILIEKVIEKHHLANIHEMWPNFSVYLWGGVSLDPYKSSLDAMFGREVRYYETYLASEGFVAFQHKLHVNGMRLLFRNNIYYEFVPFDNEHFDEHGKIIPGAQALGLLDVEEGRDYAIVLSTGAGAWRYLLGDTIKFVDKENCLIKITGRIKHFLSICGEHLSVDNMTQALQLTAHEMGINITEFTVKGKTFPDGNLGHQWYIASNASPDLTSEIIAKLDLKISELNDDYTVERKHGLKHMEMEVLSEKTFMAWMEKHHKIGSQNKFPRVLSNELYEDWEQFVQNS